MTVSIQEFKSKINRLRELEEFNFNIPRFFYLEKSSSINDYKSCLSWAFNIFSESPEQIFNIRTYNFNPLSSKESLATPHITDLSYASLLEILPKTNSQYSCMIDSETPDNGRLAGNIVFDNSSKTNPKFTLEFVLKKKRAMVRDINSDPNLISITKFFQDPPDYLDNILIPDLETPSKSLLLHIIYKAFSFPKRNMILELTVFNKPSGIATIDLESFGYLESYIVWWEYRKF